MLRKIIWFAITSGLAAKIYRDALAARSRETVQPVKEELHTWEDEGGALPPQAS